MFIFEITTPGSWLDYEDREWSCNVEGRLQALRARFFEANAALNLFMKSRSCATPHASRVNLEIDSQLRSEIQEAMEREYEECLTGDELDEMRFEAEVNFKREKWKKGAIPWEFEHRLPLVYARTFLHAVDGFDKILKDLTRVTHAPGDLLKLHGEMAKRFPHLQTLPSARYSEDGSCDAGTDKDPQPPDRRAAGNRLNDSSRGGSAPPEYLNGSRYVSTMTLNEYGEIDISPESMHHLQEILKGVLNSFKWRGPKQHEPSA